MNIIGIGTDIVAISRIKTIWDRFGWSFANRILAPMELEDLRKSNTPISFLAKRFAAKEALAKALGTGFRGILLAEIGVINDKLGRPQLTFVGQTKVELNNYSVSNSYLSLADEKDHAIAFVILVGG